MADEQDEQGVEEEENKIRNQTKVPVDESDPLQASPVAEHDLLITPVDPGMVAKQEEEKAISADLKKTVPQMAETMALLRPKIEQGLRAGAGEAYRAAKGTTGRGGSLSGGAMQAFMNTTAQAKAALAGKLADADIDQIAQTVEGKSFLLDLFQAEAKEAEQKMADAAAVYEQVVADVNGSPAKAIASFQTYQKAAAEAGDEVLSQWWADQIAKANAIMTLEEGAVLGSKPLRYGLLTGVESGLEGGMALATLPYEEKVAAGEDRLAELEAMYGGPGLPDFVGSINDPLAIEYFLLTDKEYNDWAQQFGYKYQNYDDSEGSPWGAA
jgi:hypothetical protein